MCLCFTRKFRWSEAEPPEDVRAAFRSYAAGGTHMTADQLRKFLVEQQGEPDAVAERLLEHVRISRQGPRSKLSRGLLTLEDFHHLLFSDELNPPISNEVHQDMTAPLSHYYIYTGHNSYLTGNQLSSDCSDVPIIRALKRGVRVIELDMWPNSTKDNINILHGRTLTAPVQLLKCLKSIRENAFASSPYPVIITLEDHLTSDLQAKAAKMITETFGDMLYIPETDSPKEFPSPESLKRRIIISTKPPKEYLALEHSKGDNVDSIRQKETEDDDWGGEDTDVRQNGSSVDNKKTGNENEDYCDADGEDDDYSGEEDDDDPKVQQSSAPEYRRIITIPAGKPKGGLKEALTVDPDKVRRLSLSEQQLEKASVYHGADVVRFTQKNILRVYPKGTRFNSSNYNPMVGWTHGAQMVAFNMQGYGRSLWLMHGFYRANGGCGFVKKPSFLLNGGPHGKVFDPKASLPVKKTLKVKVYMGDGWRLDFKQTHFDAYSPPDFYTKVGIAGVPADCAIKKTKTLEDDWTPVWNEEFVFPLTVPELAVLRVEVHEYDMSEKDDFGGQTCLPVAELKPGIRAVPLFDRKGNKYPSVKLLMRFEFL